MLSLETLSPDPDGLEYSGFSAQLSVYVEIVSFQKLPKDAKRRNETFFEEGGIA